MAKTINIQLVRSTCVDGKDYPVGTVVPALETTARMLVNIGKARYVEQEDAPKTTPMTKGRPR